MKTALPSRRELNCEPVDVSRRVPRKNANYMGGQKNMILGCLRSLVGSHGGPEEPGGAVGSSGAPGRHEDSGPGKLDI